MSDENPDRERMAFYAEYDFAPPEQKPCWRCEGKKCVLCRYTGRDVERSSFQAQAPQHYEVLSELDMGTHQYLRPADLEQVDELMKKGNREGWTAEFTYSQIAVLISELAWKHGLEAGKRIQEGELVDVIEELEAKQR